MKRFVVAIIFLTIVFRVAAQDYIFSQYYLDKFSINPAFAGIGAYSEVGTIFRDQWPGIEKGYKIYSAYYRQKLPSVQSGLALRVNGNVSGGAYSQNAASVIYAYDFHCKIGIKFLYILGNNKIFYLNGLFVSFAQIGIHSYNINVLILF